MFLWSSFFCGLTSTTSSLRVPTSVKNLTFLARLVSIRYGAGHKKTARAADPADSPILVPINTFAYHQIPLFLYR